MAAEIVMESQSDLFQIVDALRTPRGLARLLYRRQEERHKHRDDGNDDQQLD
jgi:hypothetical protein